LPTWKIVSSFVADVTPSHTVESTGSGKCYSTHFLCRQNFWPDKSWFGRGGRPNHDLVVRGYLVLCPLYSAPPHTPTSQPQTWTRS
jgi:hypothetical protein